MHIDSKYKIRSVAGKNIIILQGQFGADTTKVLELNNTSLWLWNKFEGTDEFKINNVEDALIENYKIDAKLAKQDAKQWVESLIEFNIIVK